MRFSFISYFFILSACSISTVLGGSEQLREAEVKLWESAEFAAKVLVTPAKIIFGTLTGCEVAPKENTSTCPNINIQKYKNIKDNSLTDEEILEIIQHCSPMSQRFPENNLNSPDSELTEDCENTLAKVIVWKSNFEGEQVDTNTEKNLKKTFIKGIWGVLFLPRVTPASYSKNGDICPSLERQYFGSINVPEYSYEKWYRGELIQTDIIDVFRTLGVQVGFQKNDVCSKKKRVYMYFDPETETMGLCREGASAVLDKSMLYLSSTIIHETRHSANLFGGTSSHEAECEKENDHGCDEGEFGAYGAEFIYADQIINGHIKLLRDLPEDSEERKNIYKIIQTSLAVMCESNRKIFYKENLLYSSIDEIRPCADNNKLEYLEANYGLREDDIK